MENKWGNGKTMGKIEHDKLKTKYTNNNIKFKLSKHSN